MATRTKRLFLFGGYDCDGMVDDTLKFYLEALGRLGDVIVVMDNNLAPDDLKKIQSIPGVLHAMAMAHGEYDFGSYRRGFEWARGRKILSRYDWIYWANDSVYGPFGNLAKILETLENSGADFIGMTQFGGGDICLHVGTYFCGMRRQIMLSDFMMDFMNSIDGPCDHDTAVYQYEMRLSQIILNHGYQVAVLDTNDKGLHEIYDRPLAVMARGVPFLKKRSVHLVGDLKKLAPYVDEPRLLVAIAENMRRRGVRFENGRYKKVSQVWFLGLPVWVVRRKCDYAEYKAYLFGLIPVVKWARHGRP